MLNLDILKSEREQLRAELQQLKNCQLQYFILSVTGTAALFALASMRENQTILTLVFLAPLTIIIPCWWIFFDKATTITRIVGYYRILEEMINDYSNTKYPYLGFENALAYYREKDNDDTWKKFKNSQKTAPKKNNTKPKFTRHRYWTINFWTYTVLSFLCFLLSLIACWHNKLLLLIPMLGLIIIVITFINTNKLLTSLKSGDFSYIVIRDFWHFIFVEYQMSKRPNTGV